MNKKKLFLGIASCLLTLGISFGGTYAYLISSDTAKNEFVVGENIVEIDEEYDPPEKLEPGITITKKPCVKNTGNLPCYVRVRADFSDSKAAEFCEPLEIDTANWEYNAADGYYYYKHLLEPEESTTYLFEKVVLKTQKADGTAYTEQDMIAFDILVYAESCQHNDHAGNHADDEYKTIWNKEGNAGNAD